MVDSIHVARIVTHAKPHGDEYLARTLLIWFGEEEYSGVESAPIVYVDANSHAPDGKSEEDLLREGTLPIGAWRMSFDEHPSKERDRVAGHSCASLVAKALGVENHTKVKHVIDYVRKEDLEGGGTSFDLNPLIKLLHSEYTPEQVLWWATMAFEAKMSKCDTEKDNFSLQYIGYLLCLQYPTDSSVERRWTEMAFSTLKSRQVRFLACEGEFDANAAIETISVSGSAVKVVSIVSDNPMMPGYARTKIAGSAGIVIKRDSRGLTQIFTKWDRATRFDMTPVHRALVEAEAMACRIVPDEVDNWYHQVNQNGHFILNGSHSAPNVMPTALSLETICSIIKKQLV